MMTESEGRWNGTRHESPPPREGSDKAGDRPEQEAGGLDLVSAMPHADRIEERQARVAANAVAALQPFGWAVSDSWWNAWTDPLAQRKDGVCACNAQGLTYFRPGW